MTFSRTEFLDLCRHAAIPAAPVAVPAGIDPVAMMWAIGSCESSLGSFCMPRFEDAYSHNRKGRYSSKALHDKWGDFAACSLGPWQIMYANAVVVDPDVTPLDMLRDPLRCAVVSGRFLAREIKLKGITTPEQALRTWNTGRPDGKTYSDWYVPRGLAAYKEAEFL